MKKIFWLMLCSLVIFLIFLAWNFFKYPLKNETIFFDVGQGDAAMINFVSGQRVMVDCGISQKVLANLGKYLPFYERTIDYLIISHPDTDHYGGCLSVLENYKVKHIVLNGDKKTDDYAEQFARAAEREKAEIKIIDHPQKWTAGNAVFEFLLPDNSLGKVSGNSASVVFSITTDKIKFLFVGDLENDMEKMLLQRYCPNDLANCPVLKSDILKVGHHGSDTSSGEDFLAAIQPKKAVISVGENSFGHPSRRTIRKLERLNTLILRTDTEGDIIMNDW